MIVFWGHFSAYRSLLDPLGPPSPRAACPTCSGPPIARTCSQRDLGSSQKGPWAPGGLACAGSCSLTLRALSLPGWEVSGLRSGLSQAEFLGALAGAVAEAWEPCSSTTGSSSCLLTLPSLCGWGFLQARVVIINYQRRWERGTPEGLVWNSRSSGFCPSRCWTLPFYLLITPTGSGQGGSCFPQLLPSEGYFRELLGNVDRGRADFWSWGLWMESVHRQEKPKGRG